MKTIRYGRALGGLPVRKGSALYLALEDTPRRLQARMRQMLGDKKASNKLHLFTEWPRMPEGLRLLDQEMGLHDDLRLVVIDTFAKFKPLEVNRAKSSYDTDYEHTTAIKSVADKHGVAILLIHHLRKLESDDVFDQFSGTLGLTGSADGLLALVRKSSSGDAVLHVTGRDVEPAELAMRFVPEFLSWNTLGDAAEVQSTEGRQKILNALKEHNGPASPKDIETITELKGDYVRQVLLRLVQEEIIGKTGRGQYIYKRLSQ